MNTSSADTLEVVHRKKRSRTHFEGTLPILDEGEAPHDIILDGPCGIVAAESADYLFAVGSFGVKVAEEALKQYVSIQRAVLRGEDVPCSDLFFLLDSVRRSNRRRNDEAGPGQTDSAVSTATPETDRPNGGDSLPADSDGAAGPGGDPSDAESDEPDPAPAPAEPVLRRLVLQPEEVLFLSHALGCVRVTAEDAAELAGDALYRHLAAQDRHLAARYAAYLALRARGWVVRDGLLAGADFVVYKRGPAFYHASLVASIQVVSAETRQPLRGRNWRSTDWLYLAGLCRTAEQTAKEVLVVRLLWPDALEPADLTYLGRVSVQEVLIHRWTPSLSS